MLGSVWDRWVASYVLQLVGQDSEKDIFAMDEAELEQFTSTIDRLESDLLQHVRTSGLKKERETFLVDELLGTSDSASLIISS